MFDTNTVSDIISGIEMVLRRVETLNPATCRISAVTAGEIAYGLARRPDATRLHRLTAAVMERLEVLPWDQAAAARYGLLRADQERQGRSLGALDMMIAAHALATGATLFTNDKAFQGVPDLRLVDARAV
ncbi:tRNA(fMet)-specific endonuclease VapC [Endobacter medicaginis]|uniref:Ribonuclease VapC n=1 Tax=Endobacter medicaginis TaxID=1181271 RepID=A0A839V3E1_9PROT|nr:type II toxin-antitoxin system VapC family toxin [Endobacter medicaginis]MBB3175375.1 tRNA(fMet)-specific endonuclease VapC [Endobacter medicaginis]NVN29412.1 type II toxin-antitoxin system VapC family toxin [Endobacter medicaginis]